MIITVTITDDAARRKEAKVYHVWTAKIRRMPRDQDKKKWGGGWEKKNERKFGWSKKKLVY